MGSAPTLNDVMEQYGEAVALSWISAELYDFAEFVGCRWKLQESQYNGLSRIILAKYPHLKLTEVMLFFFTCKSGKYGHFYGTIEPMTVMGHLASFVNNDRNAIIHARDVREKARSKAADGVAGKPITYEEYLRIKVKNGDFSGAFGEDARKLQAQLASNQPF